MSVPLVLPAEFLQSLQAIENLVKLDGGGRMQSFKIEDILKQNEQKICLSPPSQQYGAVSRFSSPSLSSPKKLRKSRTIFTDDQVAKLEKAFQQHKYLSVAERQLLAHRMGLSDVQVKTWYQNRRTKWKRESLEKIQASQPVWLPPPAVNQQALLLFLQQSLLPRPTC